MQLWYEVLFSISPDEIAIPDSVKNYLVHAEQLSEKAAQYCINQKDKASFEAYLSYLQASSAVRYWGRF